MLLGCCSYGLERIDVVVDNADGVFMGGQTIQGTVVLQLSAPIEALGENLIFYNTYDLINI